MNAKSSCISKEPLSKFDEDGSASILNYNLPQSVSYDVLSFLKLDLASSNFRDKEREAPENDFWSKIADLKADSIAEILNGTQYSNIPRLQNLSLNLNSNVDAVSSGVVVKAANIPISTVSLKDNFSSVNFIAKKIANGYMPVLYKRLSGKQGLRFVKEPSKASPAIYIIMHLRMASYLGDYGAGQTIKTFSLLPGEKTTISVRTYEKNEETQTSSQSILDSYSESCSDELQTTIEESYQMSASTTETDTDSMSANLEVNAGGKIDLGLVELGGGSKASGEASSVNTTTEALSSQMSLLNSSVSHHVQTADTNRQIEINTESSTTATEEEEQTITRTLENINKSRVLNFVFRQLLQEYFTITYLDDVTFMYYNGYPKSKRTATLSTLRSMLRKVLIDTETAKAVNAKIWEHLCNITDYTGTKISFIEQVEDESRNCIDPDTNPTKNKYVRKRHDLVQTYKDKSVNGIILDVTSRILRTPAVMVDAMLGQGEALDCYNMQLQDAAYTSAHLENKKSEQMIAILEGITDPIEKAKLYKKVFTDCCDVPQSCCCWHKTSETNNQTG